MSSSDITARFLQCLDTLVAAGTVKSRRHFALSVGYHAQGISEMVARRRDVPLDLIEKSVFRFGFSAHFLLTGTGNPFLTAGENNINVHNLSIVTDDKGLERIVHVPVVAQAGYGGLHNDAVFVRDLPSYQLPDPQFKSGTYRSFEIAGASMEPTFRQNDIVIASFVEPRYWSQAIKDGNLLVIVTHEQVYIKRVLNLLKSAKCLECISDNPEFQTFRIDGTDLREIWRARMKLTAHLDNDVSHFNTSQITQQLEAQHKMLEHLNYQLSQVTHS